MKINIQWEFKWGKSFEWNVQIEKASLSEVKSFLMGVMPSIVASVYESVLEKMVEAPLPKDWKVAAVSLLLTEVVKEILDEMDSKLNDFIWKLPDNDE